MFTLTMSFDSQHNLEEIIKTLLTKEDDDYTAGFTSMGERYLTLYFGNKKEARLAKKKVVNSIENAEDTITFDIDEVAEESYEEDF